MKIFAFVLFTVMTATIGCSGGSPTNGTFSSEVKPLQIVRGQKQEVELTIHYTLQENPAAAMTVSYNAQLIAPQSWTVDTGSWEHSQTLKTTDIGFRETRKVSVGVPAVAVPGEHVLTLTITPNTGQALALDLKLQVIGK
jgi:hypothetical protein